MMNRPGGSKDMTNNTLKLYNFNKHQNPHKNEKEKGSDIPDIYQNDVESVMFSDNLEDIDEYGTVFGPTVVMAAKEGSLLFRDAFHLLGVNDYTFGCLAERYANL